MTPVVIVVASVLVAAFIALVLIRPVVSLVVLVVLDVSNLNQVIADQIGMSLYKPQLALAVLALVLVLARNRPRFAWSPVLLGLMVLFAAFCLSFVDAANPAASETLLFGRARDLMYFVIVLGLLVGTRSVSVVVRAAVVVLAALAGLTIVHEYVLHNVGDLYGLSRVPLVQQDGASTARHAGTSSDVNFWGRLLILFLPLAASLAASSGRRRARLFWVGCVLSLAGGVYLTQSRGAFIALFVALVCWLALAGGRYRKAILFIPVALLLLVPLSGIGSRLLSLGSIGGTSGSGGDPSVIERKRLQLAAWHMFLDRPLFGHGIGSYATLFPSYDRLSNAYEPVKIVVAAHNFYLEQAADGGAVLLLGWAVFAGTVLFVCLRTLQANRSSTRTEARFLSVGLITGVVGWGVASVFLHLSDFRGLLLVAAIAAVLDLRTRQQLVPVPAATLSRRSFRRTGAVALLTLSVLALGGIAAVLTHDQPVWTNTATLAVVPSSSTVSGSTAYEVDVVSRGVIVPTLAEVLKASVPVRTLAAPSVRSKASVDVSESRLGGSIVVTVTAATQQEASDLGAAAVTLSKTAVTGLNSSYELSGGMSGPKLRAGVPQWTAIALAGLALVALITSLPRLRYRPRRAAERLPASAPSSTTPPAG